MKSLSFGVGINDADYQVRPTINGKRVTCKFYMKWYSMLSRCYSGKVKQAHPTYAECTSCHEWLTFSNFKKWMESQDWQGKEIDKDILFPGNKVYSPERCVFVDSRTNSFIIDSRASRGEWPIGVNWHRHNEKFHTHCRNPFIDKQEYIGEFDCPQKAHEAWRKRKHQLALQLADLQTDDRVAAALRIRYQTTTVQRIDSE